MGQLQSQKTNNGSTPARSEPNPDDDVRCVELEGTKFVEGRFHFAIKCTWLSPREGEGQKCVEKHLKSSNACYKIKWDDVELLLYCAW